MGLAAFWGGFWAGVNYAASFVIIHCCTGRWPKRPAMTAPAMAAKLRRRGDDAKVEAFVDEVAHLIRSQAAGIFGNLMLAGPLVLACPARRQAAFGAPLVAQQASTCCTPSPAGPTALRRLHRRAAVRQLADRRLGGELVRLPPARQRDRLEPAHRRAAGRARAALVQLVAAAVSGRRRQRLARADAGHLVPAITASSAAAGVRHVTLSTGQLAAALGALGFRCCARAGSGGAVAGIAVTGVLGLTVSFALAFNWRALARHPAGRAAAASSGAIRARLRHAPLSVFRRKPAGRGVVAAALALLAAGEHRPPHDEQQDGPAPPALPAESAT